MNDPSLPEFYCSHSIRLARNTVIYPKSISPWSPFAPGALARIQEAAKHVSTLSPDEFRQLIQCILSEYLDPPSAMTIAEGVPTDVLVSVLSRLNETQGGKCQS